MVKNIPLVGKTPKKIEFLNTTILLVRKSLVQVVSKPVLHISVICHSYEQ